MKSKNKELLNLFINRFVFFKNILVKTFILTGKTYKKNTSARFYSVPHSRMTGITFNLNFSFPTKFNVL